VGVRLSNVHMPSWARRPSGGARTAALAVMPNALAGVLKVHTHSRARRSNFE